MTPLHRQAPAPKDCIEPCVRVGVDGGGPCTGAEGSLRPNVLAPPGAAGALRPLTCPTFTPFRSMPPNRGYAQRWSGHSATTCGGVAAHATAWRPVACRRNHGTGAAKTQAAGALRMLLPFAQTAHDLGGVWRRHGGAGLGVKPILELCHVGKSALPLVQGLHLSRRLPQLRWHGLVATDHSMFRETTRGEPVL